MRMLIPTLALFAAGPVLAAPAVVVDTPVTGSLVQQVLGDLGQVQVLLPQGASVHDHQMRPSDMRGLQDAALLVWTGPELTPWLDRAAAVAGGAQQLRLLEVPGTTLRGYDDAPERGDDHGHEDHGHEDQGHDDHGHDDHGDGDDDHADGHDHGHDHAAGGVDPHAWLDPDNAQVWLTAIAGALAELDPDNADAYATNAGAAAQEIAALDKDLQARLAGHADASFVVMHDAYGYFTDHYGLKPAIAVSLGDASTPSAARLSAIRDEIAAAGVVCAFPEYGADPVMVETVIEGTGARLGGPLAPEGGEAAPGPGHYAALLTDMASAIGDCLSGN